MLTRVTLIKLSPTLCVLGTKLIVIILNNGRIYEADDTLYKLGDEADLTMCIIVNDTLF